MNKVKELITIKSIIIVSILVILCASILIIAQNTNLFKPKLIVERDLAEMQKDINDADILIDKQELIDSKYSNDIGISNEILYVKENALSNVKDSVEGTELGIEKSSKSENGMVVLDTYPGSSMTEFRLINATKEQIPIYVYNYDNLISREFYFGSIEDKKQLEEGTDSLSFDMIAPNTTYTLTNCYGVGTNYIYFFDSNKKYISNTTEKTFKTPENARYFKVISDPIEIEGVGAMSNVLYNLSLGTEPKDIYEGFYTNVLLNKEDGYKGNIPFSANKSVIYIDGADIEFKYVTK